MDFKKDYINYVLYTVIQNEFYGVRDDVRIRKILEKIIVIPDVAKATFLAGKTAGLEILFKYLLYISDKIDKSQITVFNLKDNFEYDLQNLKKICEGIKNYRSEIHKSETEEEKDKTDEEKPETEEEKPEIEEVITEESLSEESSEPEKLIEVNIPEGGDLEEESAETEEEQGFTLIENQEKDSSDDEVFGLAGITRSIEFEEDESLSESGEQENPEQGSVESESDETVSETEEESIKENEILEQPVENDFDAEDDEILTALEVEKINRIREKEEKDEKEELEIEINSSAKSEDEPAEDVKEGSVTSDVYYRFENKFFEEVKILEKLFSNAEKACRGSSLSKLSEKLLQSFSEIIEISSELGSLTRQLSLDLTADIFLTINLLFTKAINNPALINPERTKLLSSSLLLVTSLIKGEDYLGYDELVKKIELLKEELKKPAEPSKKEIIETPPSVNKPKAEEIITEPEKEFETESITEELKSVKSKAGEPKAEKQKTEEAKTAEPETEMQAELLNKETKQAVNYPNEIIEKPAAVSGETERRNMDTVLFKMKYLVKEFEKNFVRVSSAEGEYSKFEILDEVDNLNNLLKMLARTSSSVKNTDVLKLSEVSYVFLKYLKDYRMNLLDAEIQQIIKYIIFTYKMLLTDRKPEDFDVLVQYLNNPVKIFTDS